MKQCRICSQPIHPFMSFGKMPIANGFLKKEQFEEEYFFELAPAFCSNCYMVQLIEQPEPQKMFHDNYAFFSGTSKHMAVHFEKFADHVMENYLKGQSQPFPVKPYEEFTKQYPDYALLFGWNHAQEIFAKETDFIKSGGKWITYIPQVGII